MRRERNQFFPVISEMMKTTPALCLVRCKLETGAGAPSCAVVTEPMGLYDMLGNVWEWTLDRRQPYPHGTSVTEDAEDKDLRVSNDVPARAVAVRSPMSGSQSVRRTVAQQHISRIKLAIVLAFV